MANNVYVTLKDLWMIKLKKGEDIGNVSKDKDDYYASSEFFLKLDKERSDKGCVCEHDEDEKDECDGDCILNDTILDDDRWYSLSDKDKKKYRNKAKLNLNIIYKEVKEELEMEKEIDRLKKIMEDTKRVLEDKKNKLDEWRLNKEIEWIREGRR